MKFECKDLERALALPELMSEAREHARNCPACRRELWLWKEISNAAPELRKNWDSPGLWPRIEQMLIKETGARKSGRPIWHWLTAAAAVAVLAIGITLLFTGSTRRPVPRPAADFLTEQALREVERTEAAYTRSIDRLTKLAAPRLEQQTSALAASYREKLVVLDAAIKEMDATLDENPYNAYLRTELAALYREKQRTLQELLKP